MKILLCYNYKCPKCNQQTGECEDIDVKYLKKSCEFIWKEYYIEKEN
jgi:hypothetical protein